MPKQTFFNLKDEKRERFLAAAHREFALHDYAQASVSRIVAELGIAKGSLYQYFGGKEDLYYFLLDRAASAKLEYIRERLGEDAVGDFFELHARIILAGAEFDFSHPHLSSITYRAIHDSEGPTSANLSEELNRRSADFLRQFIELGVQNGEIRDDIDIDLAVYLINTMTWALEPYMEAKYGYSHLQQVNAPETPLPFSQSDLQREVRDLVSVMQRGLSTRRAEA